MGLSETDFYTEGVDTVVGFAVAQSLFTIVGGSGRIKHIEGGSALDYDVLKEHIIIIERRSLNSAIGLS
jgi:hypothetical protein